jgi:hypothetical protein
MKKIINKSDIKIKKPLTFALAFLFIASCSNESRTIYKEPQEEKESSYVKDANRENISMNQFDARNPNIPMLEKGLEWSSMESRNFTLFRQIKYNEFKGSSVKIIIEVDDIFEVNDNVYIKGESSNGQIYFIKVDLNIAKKINGSIPGMEEGFFAFRVKIIDVDIASNEYNDLLIWDGDANDAEINTTYLNPVLCLMAEYEDHECLGGQFDFYKFE